MHIGFLSHQLSHAAGGLHTAMLGLSHGLAQRGVQTSAFGTQDAALEQDRQAWSSTELISGRTLGPAALGFSPALAAALKRARLDVLHQHGLWTGTSFSALQWASNRKPALRIVSPHGMLDTWAMTQSPVKKRIALQLYEKRSLSQASCLHALVPAEAENIRALGYRNPISIIPNGVSLPLPTRPAEALPGNVQTLTQGQPYLLYLGRIHPKKNLPNLLQAWHALQQDSSLSNWRLIIAGWGNSQHEEQLKALLHTLGPMNAHFIGKALGSLKDSLYAHASGFVLPSLSEGLPMSALEGWSYALPGILTPECNLPQGIEQQAALQTGTHTDQISATLRQLLNMNIREREAMGTRGRELIKAEFTWDVVAEQFHGLYDWLLQGGTAPDTVQLH